MASQSDCRSIGIFWDLENCSPPSSTNGYDLVASIRGAAEKFGAVTTFKAYTEIEMRDMSARSISMRSELQASGVTVVDCPHSGQKDMVDKMLIVDSLVHALTHSGATTIIISGDRDYAYLVSTLRLRKLKVVVITPSTHVHRSLFAQATQVIWWDKLIGSSSALDFSGSSSNLDPLDTSVSSLSSNSINISNNSSYSAHGMYRGASHPGSNAPQHQRQSQYEDISGSPSQSTLGKATEPLSEPIHSAQQSNTAVPNILGDVIPPPLHENSFDAFLAAASAIPTPTLCSSPPNVGTTTSTPSATMLPTDPMPPENWFPELISTLEFYKSIKVPRPYKDKVLTALKKLHGPAYTKSGCSNWTEALKKAEMTGVIISGGEKGKPGGEWVSISPPKVSSVPAHFMPLVHMMEEMRLANLHLVPHTHVEQHLLKADPSAFTRFGFSDWNSYSTQAESDGIVILSHAGENNGQNYIALHPRFRGFHSSRQA